jgi:uncharacterized membrane protein
MATYKVDGEVQAPIEKVWTILSAVESWPTWLPTVSSVESLDSASISPGSRFRVRQPKLRPAVWTVSELEPPLRFAWQAKSPGMELFADHALERIRPDSTRVHLRFEFRGWLGRLLGAAYGSITQAYLEQEMQALKRVAEKAP